MSLKDKYVKEVIPKVKQELGLKNDLQVPRLSRIVVNVGIGKIAEQEAQVKKVEEDLRKITGQAPVYAIAKKAISGFKVKEGDKIGIKVTLRGKRMWDFLERLIVGTLPRIKDFQGIAHTNFNQTGDCSVGIREHIVFPEINPDETSFVFGLQVNIVTTAKTQNEGIVLLKALGFPVRDEK
ncbi:MAG: 50S ribosomal protein L5 [Candidatus Moraniibacteriota bacterium]